MLDCSCCNQERSPHIIKKGDLRLAVLLNHLKHPQCTSLVKALQFKLFGRDDSYIGPKCNLFTISLLSATAKKFKKKKKKCSAWGSLV